MLFQPQRTAIVGATGPTGVHLARELLRRGLPVRVVSRRREHLDRVFSGLDVELAVGDALDPAGLGTAVAGCDLIVDCIGLPPERMADHPATARNVAAAARAERARCLQVSSYWAFFPHRGEMVSEAHPRQGGHPWFRWRREAEDILIEAGAAVVHLPDFFGPDVHTSSVQIGLQDAVAGKPVSSIGSPDRERESAFIPDAMAVVAELCQHDEAYGTDWAIPGNGMVSPRRLAEIAGAHLGREIKVRSVSPWMLKLLALMVPSLRPVVPLAPHYARPVRYDTSKLRGILGEASMRPLPEAITATLDWLAGTASAAGA